ncbi:MAG: hypothetical protein DRQ39_08195 [Gammaproteobacteria bacterium]|nr:MAG: hypothetical protein DRQ39_08195 [Gammaproteobacteria bacterium]
MNGVKKFDEGKPDLSYITDAPVAMEGFARVMKLGESKYGRSNWKLHDDSNRLIAALLRHLMAWQNGEKIDPESNLSHLHHVVANAVMLAENETLMKGKSND